MLEVDPGLYDKEASLVGPEAFRRAVVRDFEWARKRGVRPAIAVLQVKRPSPEVSAAVGISLKSNRQGMDVAARLDETTFAVLLGCSTWGSAVNPSTDVLKLLEQAATAAAEAGSGDVTARTFWLKPECESAEEWIREATLWRL